MAYSYTSDNKDAITDGVMSFPVDPLNRHYRKFLASGDPVSDYVEPAKSYEDARRSGTASNPIKYDTVENQLGMQYDDLINGTTTWRDHVAAVKSAHKKPT